MKKKFKYMHTLDGDPAMFSGKQICFASQRRFGAVTLVDSLKEIREQQKLTQAYRKENNYNTQFVYGWCLVRVS